MILYNGYKLNGVIIQQFITKENKKNVGKFQILKRKMKIKSH